MALLRRLVVASASADDLLVRRSVFTSRAFLSSTAAAPSRRREDDSPALVYSEHGDPERVLSYVRDAGFGEARGAVVDRASSKSSSTSTSSTSTSFSSSSSSAKSVLVRWLASPVNWSDVNVVEGTYPGAPRPPATPGNEGAGVVEEVYDDDGDGDAASSASSSPSSSSSSSSSSLPPRLRPGDLVVPLVPAAGALGGTWRRYSLASREDLHRVDPSLGLDAEQAATLCIK